MKKKSTSPSGFLSLRAITILFCATAACSALAVPLLAFLRPQEQVNGSQRTLSFEERVSYQRAIEDVYWRNRIWPNERPDPKPSLDAMMSNAQLEKKVTDYLRNSQALENYWRRPITAEQLQAEMDRMARHTRQPEVLRELFEALRNDPFVIAECLARPALAERLLTDWYAYDQRIHGELKQRAQGELQAHNTVEQMKQTSGKYSEIEFVKRDTAEGEHNRRAQRRVTLSSREWDQTMQSLAATFNSPTNQLKDGRDPAIAGGRLSPSARPAVAPYQTLPLGKLSSFQEDEERYYATVLIEKTKEHLKLATVSWLKEPLESWLSRAETQVPNAMPARTVNYTLSKISDGTGCAADTWTATAGPPDGRYGHTAVWSGSEMIIWGGGSSGYPNFSSRNTGARYNPSTDTWTATNTNNAPTARAAHTAVWTGNEMIIWGGADGFSVTNTGGRYNPTTNSWTATSTINAPSPRVGHAAVWTGSEMIVWGGTGANTGGRYNPNTDSWTATSATNAPAARYGATAIWTGSEMVVWGGTDDLTGLNTGGRYNPSANSWTATSTSNAPVGRYEHTAIWTGSEMIVWGGYDVDNNQYLDTGGRYNPDTNTWTATGLANAPDPHGDHTAVWTGDDMIVWGGFDDVTISNTGGRYNPATNSRTATNTNNAPTARSSHTAVWTGTEMIVWGGQDDGGFANTGGRYDPNTNSWIPTNTYDVPEPRGSHTAVWTGIEMIIWGGVGFDYFNSGGRYDLAADSWTATGTLDAPASRFAHTAIWSGSEMIVWGGQAENSVNLNTGGRYNPSTNAWVATSTTDAPTPRQLHTAIWTGSEMIVWGGWDGFDDLNTGGRYNPQTDTWTVTSTTDAPMARDTHTAIWTGNEMIAWGGWSFDSQSYLNTGGRYDPATNSWTATETTNAPEGRSSHTAVWTGSEMIVWGGRLVINTGGRYDPTANNWTPTSMVDAPDGRFGHTAVWTGSEMIVWGGAYMDDNFISIPLDTGSRYNPDTDGWTATSLIIAPDARYTHTAVWTGNEMIVWGGDAGGTLNTGGRYCAQAGPTPTPSPTPTPTPCVGRCEPTPRPHPTPHVRPSPR
jgi:N-acetylneuraminic acid mutarotase